MKNPYAWLNVSSFSVINLTRELISVILGKKDVYVIYSFIIKGKDNFTLNTYTHYKLVYRPFIHGIFPMVTVRLKVSFRKWLKNIVDTSDDLTLHVKRSIVDRRGRDHESKIAVFNIKDLRPITIVDRFNWNDAYTISQQDHDKC